MTIALSRPALRAAALAAVVLVAACSGRGASDDDALHRDLQAAGGDGLALAPRGSQTQVVSALELGASAKASPTAAPARAAVAAQPTAPQPAAARALPPRIITRIRYVDRVVQPEPAPERNVATAPAPAPEPTASAPATEPATVGVPSPGSRHYPEPVDGRPRPERHRRPWDMGDVIRNAPFPINP